MPTIQLRTPIPGPKSQELMRRRNAAVARGVAHATPIFAARAEGATLDDVDGNRYIDFAGGIGCLNVGHRAPGVLNSIRGQLDAFLHTCGAVRKVHRSCRKVEFAHARKISQENYFGKQRRGGH